MSLAEELADYACGLRYSDLGKATVEETKKRVLDALGCAIGAYSEAPVRIAREVAAVRSGGRSTIIGTRAKVPPDVAAFVNGLMIRYFDFNDTYLSKEPAHPSDNIGATLSVAEAVGASGKEFILATALAYEVQCRLCDSADIRHRGWDHVCYGLVSSALGAGRLMGLDRKRMAQAVNIALNGHIAMRQVRAGELSMWKGASFSNAARNAVFAAELSRAGMTGPSPIFEGEMGFFKQVSGPFELDVGAFGGRRGRFKVLETYVKYFPAEYHAQTAVWAALRLREKVGDPGLITDVEVATHEAGFTILGKDPEKWRPPTKETADHSLPYMVGMALLTGKVDNETYSDANIRSRKVLDFLTRISVKEDPALTALYPSRGMPTKITLKTKSGRTLTEEVVVPRGHPLNPMTAEEMESKFRSLAAPFMAESAAGRFVKAVARLDESPEVGRLMPLLRVRAAGSGRQGNQ